MSGPEAPRHEAVPRPTAHRAAPKGFRARRHRRRRPDQRRSDARAARRAGIGPRGRRRAGGTHIARGEFSIVITGLAVGAEPRIGPLATAYVLILVILGPLAARWTEPLARRATHHRPHPAPPTAGSPKETARAHG